MLTDANATRTDGLLTVRLIGKSPTSYDEATIVGFYPGTIMHFRDPNSAQIFIREGRKPELENMYCTQALGNIWILNHVIRDNYHKTVEIFINDRLVRKIRAIELSGSGMNNIIDL
ncbi:hypothetical protein NDK43_19285 [Neobacillus pocheonensis]|uniref:Uncharacterized protein n=1 Tax=Neobacillus pocheonensis TaxID=363869 RepID=A0ABT0WCT0_9BACI|nr:hypothetical protein [Neobacillus pocheonensis]